VTPGDLSSQQGPTVLSQETHGKFLTSGRINRQGREGRAGTGKVFSCWAG